jgi:glycosyltransferase involved in cell wall biosynthesis
MKILLVSGQFRPLVGGVPSVYENLCRHLGDTVTVLTQPPADSPEVRAWDDRQPYTIRRIRRFVSRTGSSLPKPFSWGVRYVSNQLLTRARVRAELSRVLEEVRPDVVCFGTLLTTWWLAPLARSRRLPIVYYIHAEEVCGIRQSRMDGDGPKNALLQADALIAVSRFTRDVIRDLGGDVSRVHILSNGVDTGRFRPGPQDSASC